MQSAKMPDLNYSVDLEQGYDLPPVFLAALAL